MVNANNQRTQLIRVEEDERDGGLVTPTSLALSLAPPRGPPVGSIQHSFLLGKDSRTTEPTDVESLHPQAHRKSYLFRIKTGLHVKQRNVQTKQHRKSIHKKNQSPSKPNRHLFLPHPHLSDALDFGEKILRYLGGELPISVQHSIRDSGRFRSISDGLVTMSVPSLALFNPSAAHSFLDLTKRMKVISYGDHHMQEIHLIEPNLENCGNYRGLLFFVHGGAWGSGLPWMYRLTALPFLDAGITVAVVGYRTYPDANALEQVNDLEQAASVLASERPDLLKPSPKDIGIGTEAKKWVGLCISGHSSGAHISLFMLVERVKKILQSQVKGQSSLMDTVPIPFDSFIGLSGPYSISHHFDFEAGRGVEELSPMKPACGYTRNQFNMNSPAIRLSHILTEFDENNLLSVDKILPRMLLVHGVEDTTVPFTATSDCSKLLRACGVSRCEELYLGKTGHEHTVMHFMMGGKTKDAVMEWLLKKDDINRIDANRARVDFSGSSRL